MERAVNVVVTCTKRKTRAPDPNLRLRNVAGNTPESRAEAWLQRIIASTAEPVNAEDLYAGDHWSVVRSFGSVAEDSGRTIKLWICSAGYGLIPAAGKIASYSATFSVPHPDAVYQDFEESSREVYGRWWRVLAGWEGPVPGAPRTIQALAEQLQDSPILVIASTPYLRAMQEDLIHASETLQKPESLVVLSAGTQSLTGLQPHLVPFDSRLRQLIGGGMLSLNVRTAREILRRGWSLRTSELNSRLRDLHRGLEQLTPHQRAPQADEKVKEYIRDALKNDPSITWTPLLRRLRDELGWACEQKRFKALYLSVRGLVNCEPSV